jgi:hypothetical protein
LVFQFQMMKFFQDSQFQILEFSKLSIEHFTSPHNFETSSFYLMEADCQES